LARARQAPAPGSWEYAEGFSERWSGEVGRCDRIRASSLKRSILGFDPGRRDGDEGVRCDTVILRRNREGVRCDTVIPRRIPDHAWIGLRSRIHLRQSGGNRRRNHHLSNVGKLLAAHLWCSLDHASLYRLRKRLRW
jgi:hypothetical protein